MENKARLIDAHKLIIAIQRFRLVGVPNTLKLMLQYLRIIINEQPTVDAVEVVRCKDCKNYFYSSVSMGMRCRLDGTEWRKDDFCSCGERGNDG